MFWNLRFPIHRLRDTENTSWAYTRREYLIRSCAVVRIATEQFFFRVLCRRELDISTQFALYCEHSNVCRHIQGRGTLIF
jgi:hypothetical protein